MNFTINDITITFTEHVGVWTATAEIDYVNYFADDISFIPLTSISEKQLKALFKAPAELKVLSDCLMLSFELELLDQTIIIQLNKEVLDDNKQTYIANRMQLDIIKELNRDFKEFKNHMITEAKENFATIKQQADEIEESSYIIERQAEEIEVLKNQIDLLDPSKQKFRVAIWWRADKGLSFEAENKEDEPKLQKFLDIWWKYLENRYCCFNPLHKSYFGCSLQKIHSEYKRISSCFVGMYNIMSKKNVLRKRDHETGIIDSINFIPGCIASMYDIEFFRTYTGNNYFDQEYNNKTDIQFGTRNSIQPDTDKMLGCLHLLNTSYPYEIVRSTKLSEFQNNLYSGKLPEGYPSLFEWDEDEWIAVIKPAFK